MKAPRFSALSTPAFLATLLMTGAIVTQASAAISFGMALLPVETRGLGLIQYGAQNPPYGYDRDRDRYDERDRGYGYDRDFRGHKWRPGEVLPPDLMGRVVPDWEERGLSRPPGGHEWVRIGYQFILVRDRDRMIARILNFD